MNKKNLEIKGRELELFLIHHPSVLQIKVEEEQDKQIAYFVPTANQSPKKYELRQYVKQNMTVDLSSTVFVEVPSLEQAEGTFFPMSPSTVTEELVAEIWEIWSDRVVTDVHELFLEQTVAEDMVDHLQQTFEVELSTEILLGFPLNEVAEYIDTQLEVGKVTEVVNKDNPVILSSSQQRLWFWEQLIPGTTVYSVPAAYRLTGHIEVERLQQAFEQVITRHGILRVTFHANEKGVPEQRIQSSMENWFSFQDLCKEEQPEKVVNTLIQHHLDQPFDLEQGPLFRVSLYRLEEEWRLLIQAHHLVMDGWSLGILIKDFASFYEGVQVSPNQYDYLDYAIAEQEKDWNREEEQLKYWVDKLQDMPATQLSTDYPRPAKESYRGSAVTTSLSSSLVRQLRHVAQSTNSSLYMVLLTAFKLLLSRYSGEKEMVVGSPVAGRFQSEWEKVIGFFVNTIVLRTDFSDNPSWNQALDRVKDTVLDAFSYQEVPFDRVVEAVLPDRQSSLSPLFQAMFVLQNMNLDTSSDSSLHLEPIILDQKIAKFDLTLTMVERAEELDAILEYNTDLYAVSTIDRMLEQFKMILESLVTDQYTPINEVNIITTDEKRKWLEWNQTEKRYKEESLATLFEQMVQQDPNAIAIQSMNQTCSYQELNNKANQVAWYLSSQGIGHGDKVGICFERSMEFYISILGIVKLGAVYVPFDVNYPRDRFDYLLDDAQLSHVLTSSTFADRFDHKSFRFSIWEEIKFFDQNSRDFPCHATIDSLTYVMYTSGSTGLPKGVEITARGIVRLVQNPNYMQIHKDDVFLQLSPVAFDAATLEIWGSFLNGAKLVIMPSGSPTLEEISQEIIKNKVTILWLTAGLFRLFVEEQLFSLSGLRYLLTGGDVVSASHVKQVLSLHGPQVINGYGPTENTTFTCCYPLPADWDGENSVPIGRPISGTYVYILDENGKDVPIGVPGELYIGGDGLACGYANRQELTDEKFVTLSDKGRLYRSGDLVRIDSNGLIHFIGRLDNQVKVRGFRVELGEIEAVLATHADVNDVVVLAKEDHSGKQLVAYVQTNKEINWKSWLESTLPSYMIPSRFLSLPTFPLTSNGKIDRKQLDALELPMDRTTENVVEPVKEEEKQLHSIWSEVLGHDQFGIHHNFFSIGGHSLLATQVIARVHKVFDISLPLQSLFTAPTIAEFVLHLQNQNEKETLFSIHTEKNGEIPASFGQKRLWFMDQYTTDQSIYHMPFMVEIKGTLHQDQLEKSYLALLERHASMRTNFYFKEGQLFQKISEPSNDCFEYEDLRYSDHSEDEAKQNMDQVINRAFDLANGPLAVLYAYQLTNEHWYLLFHLHHIVADGGSLPILMDELFVIYHDKELPPLTLQYADYAWQEQAWMENESMQQELGYWKTKLADLPVLDLPTDHPRGSEQTFAGATYSVTLSEELRAGIARWSKKQGTTFYMTTLAVFQTLLARYTGSTDIAVGSPVAGRSHAEWESLIGFFVNTLVFRNDLSGEPTWNDVLQRVKQGAIEAYSHATVPFERVVEEVAPDRHLSHSPLFQVMFSVETDAWQAPEVAGLAMQEVALPQTTAKFDLTLHLTQLDQGLAVTFSYNTDLWEEASIARMADHLEQLLHHAITYPEEKVHHAALLTEAEEQAQLAWNGHSEFLPFVSVVDQIAQVVETTPMAPAIVADEETYTYGQWWNEANQLAHFLRKRGVQRGKVVALCSDRSPAMLIGMLAILQTGATYVPIDPHYPADRISYVVQDARAHLVLVDGANQNNIDLPASQRIVLDTSYVDWMGEPTTSLETPLAQTDTAYVIYTSGSTGKPKGVSVSHASLSHLIDWHRTTYFTGEDRTTWIAGVAFDASVWEVWPALASGVTLYVPRDELRLDPVALRDWLIEQAITVSFVPTPLLEQLLPLSWPNELALKTLLTGGDQLRMAPPAGFPVAVVNHYGPTENTVVATAAKVPAGVAGLPIIGRPINRVNGYVLDAQGELLPVGIPSELYLGGSGLAQGYHGRPDWTEERFITHPKWGRLYATGDIVRWDAKGQLHFLGRKDTQVSIRGFRVELGEIESHLQSHPLIEQAVVIAQAGRLIAYIQGTGESKQWRSWLANKLPDYMVPSVFQTIEHFPLTANGKIDRKALPAPEETPEESYTAAETEIEATLIAIWESLLGKSPIGIHDNFFHLGGDSILSIQVVSRAREKGMILKPKQLFAHQTIATLASVAETEAQVVGEQGTLVGEVPLLPIQQWFLGETKHPHHFNQSMMVITDKVNETKLQETIEALTGHHDALRMRFVPTDKGWKQTYQAENNIILEVVDLQAESDLIAALEQQAEEAQASLHLTDGPLFRAIWFRLSQEEGRLLFVVHHLIMDGVSWRIVLEDVETIYQQLTAGKPVSLPAKTSSYRQWAKHLQERATSAEIEEQRNRWRNIQPTTLPLDKQGLNTEGFTKQVQIVLTPEETAQLLSEATKKTHASVEELIVTALAHSVYQWTAEQTHAIHLESHGREEQEGIDLSRTVGWFTSLYPVILEAKSDHIAKVLQATKDSLREASEHGLSYGLLCHLHPDSLKTVNAPISFNYLGQFSSVHNQEIGFLRGISKENAGNPTAPDAVRPHLIDVVAVLLEDKLQLTLLYSSEIFHKATMVGLLNKISSSLYELRNMNMDQYALSDFPLAHLQKHELDEINGKQLEAVYPLSPLQSGMLFHSLYQHGGSEYVVQIGFELKGELDLAAYKKAWQTIIDRNAVLRTTFLWEGLDIPHQLVHRSGKLTWTEEDWRDITSFDQQKWIEEYVRKDRERGFDLEDSMLSRIHLIRLTEDSYQVIWSYHHLLIDGWSMPLLLNELMTVYEAWITGVKAALPSVRPFADYMHWIANQNQEEAKQYWQNQLAGYENPIQLGVLKSKKDGQRESVESFTSLSVEQTAELTAFCREHHLTLHTLLQGTWSLLLQAFSGETDVVYGTTVSGRPADLRGVETMVGMMINTLPVRITIPSDQAISIWLHDLQKSFQEMRQYEYCSLIDIQQWSDGTANQSLFDYLFVFENYPASEQAKEAGLSIRFTHGKEEVHYPLTLVAALGEKLHFKWMYHTDQFTFSVIQQLQRCYILLLKQIISNHQQKIGELSFHSPEEQQLLLLWAGEDREQQSFVSIINSIQKQVSNAGHQAALEDENTHISYQTLEIRANQLAHYLIEQGINAESRVAVFMERSISMVIAQLAILKTGAAYVPLDPANPADRILYQIDDAQVGMIITSIDGEKQHAFHSANKIIMGRDDYHWKNMPASAPDVTISADQAAYMIYTSGSTGVPKGVVIEHRALSELIQWHISQYQLGILDRTAMIAGVAFDASVWEIWSALAAGSTISIPKESIRLDAEKLKDWLVAKAITQCFLPTPLLEQLMDFDWSTNSKLKAVWTGGDQLRRYPPAEFPAKVFNHYGPTESTVVTTTTLIDGPQEYLPSIGRPIVGRKVYVLDSNQQLAPLGVAGELWIGGSGLAKEYWNQPSITEERFVHHPIFGRIYRSGDMVKWQEDGNLAFLGRNDSQVKINGFRLELGEIEAVLTTYPTIQDAVVLAVDKEYGKLLVAFVVADQDEQFLWSSFLSGHLPAYMVPQVFVTLEALPLTVNGKLDRSALPVPEDRTKVYEAPQNESEEKLCTIWSGILGLDQIGVTENVFLLGAHSLIVTRAISQINRAFGVKLPLQVVFENPTVRDLASNLPTKQTEQSMQTVDRSTTLSLSFAEKRLWLMDQLLEEKDVYNIPLAFEREEPLDMNVWKSSLEQMMARHEILRTCFVEKEGTPERVISEEITVPLYLVDDEESLLLERKYHFDLSSGPLWRVAVTKDLKQCLIVMHHIITDGWSFDLFFTELCDIYQAKLGHDWTETKNNSLQYADYAAWQETQTLDASYWKKQLADLPVLALPTDYPRPKVQSSRGSVRVVTWDAELWQGLKDLAKETNSTMYMTLLAVFQVLLHRYSGQKDIAVGTPVANRAQLETEEMIGFFANTLVMRGDLSGNPIFRSFIQQVRQTALDAYRHQSIPFEKVVEEVDPARSMDHSPLFQVMFTLQENRKKEQMGFVAKNLPITTSKYDLALSIGEGETGAEVVCEYNTDLFIPETIERLFAHLANLASELLVNPDQKIGEVHFLTTQEAAALTNESIPSRLKSVLSIQERILYQAIATPTSSAIESEDTFVTYKELNQKANQLAHYLRHQGIMAGDIVGICMGRSGDLVTSALAILKLGAIYVPIDPAYPEARITYLVEDAELRLVLSHYDQHLKLGSIGCYLDQEWTSIKQYPVEEVEVITPVTDLAYMVYTSGSTGLPKGVMVSHESLLHLVEWHVDTYALTPLDRTTLIAGPAFDASVWEMWPTLASGGTLVIPTEEEKIDVEKLQRFLLTKQISVSFLPTPLLESLLVLDWPAQVPLRYMLTGGDSLRIYPPTDFPVSVVNHYGPSENTVVSTAIELSSSGRHTTPPIGKSIPHVHAFVLDEYGNPVTIGVVGELYVGGAGLAAGYYNRPALTEEKFIQHPIFGRLYQTGDVVKSLEDGNLQFLGRLDRQVQIRGFRVELGEIEAVLRQHGSVAEAVVLEQAGQLVAYVVSKGRTTDSLVWRKHVQEKLPGYMVPAHFVPLDFIPLTANGKIDRSKLPDAVIFSSADSFIAPQTKEEKQVAMIWEEVLGVPVGVEDNFFYLGGHSLLAAKVIARMNHVLPFPITLRQMFESPTIAELLTNTTSNNTLLVFQQKDRPAKLPLSSAQERLWIFHQLQPNSVAYHIPLAVQLIGDLDIFAMKKAFATIVHRHESLRTSFYEEEGKVYQTIREDGHELEVETCAYEAALQSIKQDAETPFNLVHDVLYRAHLYHVDHQKFVFYVNVHHIIADGWSIQQLLHELWTGYSAITKQEEHQLPPLTMQYADYAWQEQAWMENESMQQELGYWKTKLADLPVLDLPTDHPRGSEQTFAGATYSVMLSEELRAGVARWSKEQGTTFYMTTLAVFQTLLARYTGSTDIAVGSPVAGRSHAEWESLIGFFVNTLVFRNDLSGEPTWNDVLQRVKQGAIEAYAHATVPFERVVEEVAPDRHLSHSPLFQVMFSVETDAWQAPEVAGLAMQEVALPQTTAKFDLTLHLTQLDQGLAVTFSYNTDLWEEASIARMADHLEQLLHHAIAYPGEKVHHATLLTEAEEQAQLAWNGHSEFLPFVSVVDQIAQVVETTPMAPAIVADEETYTYGQWWNEANQLAHFLRKRGVQRGKVVALCSDRSPAMLVGMLAILQTGATYVPIDPQYPADRIFYVVQDARAHIVLVDSANQNNIDLPASQRIVLDTSYVDWMGEPTTSLETPLAPTDTAYVIYTSGSTGKPKGVSVSHTSLSHLIDWHRNTYFTGEDRTTWIAGVAFDASVWEVWPALASGVTLYVPRDELRLDPVALRDWLIEQAITVSFVPTPLLEQLLPLSWPNELALKTLLTGGDQLRMAPPAGFPVAVVNHYGPTENTVVATAAKVPAGEAGLPIIGRPINRVNGYVLDAQGELLPVGIPGELYLGGSGLAQGYYGRPDWTEERFITHPKWGRLYATGDIVRWDAKGQLHFLGRKDTQVSIRGFRVELGEIESHLQSHPLIEQAVVIAQAGRLIAYIQGTGESKQWRSWLANKLPDYMVPSVFQTIEHFPLTANGKIDRKVLPAPEETPEESYTAAETEIEATLIAIWESLLGKSPIGIHDNFFHLGGDSILSIQVVSRAREKGMILKPKQLFAHQTIATLASVAETEAQVVGEQGTLVGDVPLLPIQQWFLEETKHPHHFNQSMMVTTGEVNETKLQETIEALVLHHDALRMRFVPTDKGWKQIYQAENNIELEIIDLQAASNPIAELEQRAEEAQASLHLTDGPLFRAIWFRLSQEEGRLLLVAHHLIMDGVSWRIVLEDVETIYQQLVAGKSIFLPAKTSSYRQWAKHLQEWAISTEIEEQRTYWEQVSNTNLPQDKWGMNTEKSVEQMQVLLSPEETEKLVSETTGRTHATIEEILLTAFMQALQKWTGQKKHTIHLEGHGRQEQEGIDLSRTVGWFTSLYPVTFELTSSVIGEALQVVKDTLREANKKGIGYGMLRHLHPTPLEEVDATISFNYLGKFNPVQQKDQQGLIRGTAQESAGHTIALEAVRPHLLDVIAVIYQGQLQITWLYSQNMHNKTTMESFKQYFQSHLYTLITGKEKNMGMTASDFPEADLSKKDMKKVLQFLQKKSKGR